MRDLPDLLILRHGETEWNRLGRWQGDLDSPLTEQGRAQADAMGHLLRDMGVSAASHDLFTSPQGRARATASRIAAALGDPALAPFEDARLREISMGDWTGLTRAETFARSGLPPETPSAVYYNAAPGAEPLANIAARCAGFLATIKRPAVVVTHGVTSRVLRAGLLGLALDQIDNLPIDQGVIYAVSNGITRHWTA